MDDWRKVRRGPKIASIALFVGQVLCLLAVLVISVLDNLPTCVLPSIVSVTSITAVSGATGLTVALFLWLTQRTSNQEYGVNMGDLYRWACPLYTWSFFLFALSTLATLYLGNHTDKNDYIFRVVAFGGCTIFSVVMMAIMCHCFIFSSKTRRRIAHAFLLFKIQNTSGIEQEGWFELLLASMDTCLRQNYAEGIENIFQVVDSFGEQIFPENRRQQKRPLYYRQRYEENPTSDGDREMDLFRYYLWTWERLVATVENKKSLFRLAYKRFHNRNADISQLIWLYVLTRTALPPIWPDEEAAKEFQFVNYLSTLDHSKNDKLSLKDKDALLCQFCCFYRLYIKFRAAVKHEKISEDEENTSSLLYEIVENSSYQLDEARYQFLADRVAQLLMINSCWSDEDFKLMRLSAKGMALTGAMAQEQMLHRTIFFTSADADDRKEERPGETQRHGNTDPSGSQYAQKT